MRIKNLTPRLAEIGKIKIGGLSEKEYQSKSGGTFRPPVKLDYFLVTGTHRDQNGNLVVLTEVMQVLGEKPREIPILLLFDDPELNCPTFYAWYSGKKCRCRGDGETATRKQINEKGEITGETQMKCPCEKLTTGECKPTGILSCMLPCVEQVGGVFTFRTHSWASVQNLMSGMALIQGFTRGKLAGIPMKLILRPQTVQDKSGKTNTNYVVALVHEGSVTDLINRSLAARQLEAGRDQEIKALTAQAESLTRELIEEESEDEQAAVEAEFFPIQEETHNETPQQAPAAFRPPARKSAQAPKEEAPLELGDLPELELADPPGSSESPPPPSEQEETIPVEWQKKLHIEAGNSGKTEQEFREFLKSWGLTSTKEIPKSRYQAAYAWATMPKEAQDAAGSI